MATWSGGACGGATGTLSPSPRANGRQRVRVFPAHARCVSRRFLMRHVLLSASTLVVTLAVAGTALAGPPLICHPFDIGTARSLPIGPADGGWSSIDRSYDRSRLVTDTLALLTPATPTLVRMETLRRATMYVTDDAAAARALLQAL